MPLGIGEGGLGFQSVFSVRSITRVVRSGDAQRFGQDLAGDGPAIIEAVSAAAVARTILLGQFLHGTVRRKRCVSYRDYPTNLVLRTLATYLARRFRVVPANRDRVVSGVIETMMDATPYYVVRRDVTSFYESIDADALRNRLIYDTSLPKSVRHYLTAFFDAHCPRGVRGLPRGIGLTSILAELAMEKFDQQVRALPGVYRYFRYSDDIVVFAYANVKGTEAALEALLPEGMNFNRKKCELVDFTRKEKLVTKSFEYLGYRISTEAGTGGKLPRAISVSISDAKIKRLKSRVILSLKSFMKNHNASLLVDRLRLLSSNYQIDRQGAIGFIRGKRVRSGVYYNYRRCGTYVGSDFQPAVPASLSKLDDFTHVLLKSPHSEFSSTVKAHIGAHARPLASVSFRLGFESRRMVRMTYDRLSEVKAAWRNG